MPLLWEDPFSIPISNKSCVHFLDVYFSYLSETDKSLLKEYGIERINSLKLKPPPLFNYPSFIKILNTSLMELHIMVWIDNFTKLYKESDDLFDDEIQVSEYISRCEIKYPLTEYKEINASKTDTLRQILLNRARFIPNLSQKIKYMYFLIFKTLIENDSSLCELHLKNHFSSSNPFANYIYELILNRPKFISEIKDFLILESGSSGVCSEAKDFLVLESGSNSKCSRVFLQQCMSLQNFLSSLSLICHSIKHLSLIFSHDIYSKFVLEINNLFKSQNTLSKVSFDTFIDCRTSSITESLRYCSNTLTTISFFFITFKNDMLFNELEHLIHISCLEFQCCEKPELFIQSLLTVPIPLKIKTLLLDHNEIQSITPIQLFFQKISSCLDNLAIIYQPYFMKEYLESIILYCERIEFFHLGAIDYNNLPQLFQIIASCGQLKYLTLEIKYHEFNQKEIRSTSFDIRYVDQIDDLKVSSMILRELGQLLPSNLKYLDLSFVFDPKDLKIFFDNCKHVNLRQLLIRNNSKNTLNSTLSVIKEFIREKRLDYLAYAICLYYSNSLNSLEELVKETGNLVTMKNYDDLVLKASDIDGIYRN
ncbi:8349_t:CDS:1 [Funneliformis caledonium]|uniref:8349_t:CDS:1 n=1 Tax=Funneliformis caledonium TaxID=1117310 RepID=A0A9N9D769_9GLOM|nr:8349_t:CDS:1 [Funneliformis caledonium]